MARIKGSRKAIRFDIWNHSKNFYLEMTVPYTLANLEAVQGLRTTRNINPNVYHVFA
jgi:hypothetical protein